MKSFDITGFESYIKGIFVKRKITTIQLHHTYSPSYKDFNGKNHTSLQKGMYNYHVKTNGWNDIAQHFTIFPDGIIMTGRSLDSAPAGIRGANANGVCIECLGNFDKGGDVMTKEQEASIVAVVKMLLDKFSLSAKTGVTYHAWWSSDGREIGDYVKGHSTKTCPGTNFFGGNTLTAYENNLMKRVENYGKKGEITEIDAILKKLGEYGVITDKELWLKKCRDDINVYWLCRKTLNKLLEVI